MTNWVLPHYDQEQSKDIFLATPIPAVQASTVTQVKEIKGIKNEKEKKQPLLSILRQYDYLWRKLLSQNKRS